LLKKIVSLCFSVFCISSHAQDPIVLDSVIVTGSSIAQVPIDFVWVPAGMPVYDPTMPGGYQGLMIITAATKAAKTVSDVRCVLTTDLRKVTSRNDATDRWEAASAVYIVVQGAAQVVQGVIIGKVISPFDGKAYKAFQVTYADGGTEKWLIFPSPASSVKLFDTPLPGSLVYGDGVYHPSPSCSVG